jgi:hypothetical protein
MHGLPDDTISIIYEMTLRNGLSLFEWLCRGTWVPSPQTNLRKERTSKGLVSHSYLNPYLSVGCE